MTEGAAPEAMSQALIQAQATIALLQTYVAALGGAIGLMGTFFGYKWLGAVVAEAKADVELAERYTKMTEAVNRLTEAVLRGRQAP